ncbi:protein disulfide oxidoreductase [Idiomarina seosinensis]|uniref:protein disulfide oxidoreductase n=1 Tax=Idiomarina seosinensis TaxID=281739 RepID=UPI00384FC364
MRTLTGEPIDIIEMSRKEPVLLYFWATWCPYCSVVSPMVSSLADEHAVVSVAFSSGPDAQVKDYLSEHDYRFVTVNDETGILAKRWGVSVTPTIVIVRDGVVQSVTTGLTTSPGMRARLMLAR